MVSIAIAIYVIAGQKPPVATGEIVAVWAHPQHTETSGLDANGAPMPKESFDQVLVFTQVRLHNQSKQPLFLHQRHDQCHAGRWHPLQLRGQHRPTTTASFWPIRTFRCRTAQRSRRSTPTLEPGQTVEGTFVSAFR